MRPGVIESLLDIEDLKTRSRGIEVGKMHRVAMPKAGRIKPLAIVVNHARAVDNLVPAVAVHVADAEVMIALAAIAFIAFVRAVESPQARQLAVAPVPRDQNRAGVITPTHHQAGSPAVEIRYRREETVNTIAVTIAPDRLHFISRRIELRRMSRRNVFCGGERGACQPVEDRQIL